MKDEDREIILRVPVRESIDWPGRYELAFGFWVDHDLRVCCHGEKLRWGCDECDEMHASLEEADHA